MAYQSLLGAILTGILSSLAADQITKLYDYIIDVITKDTGIPPEDLEYYDVSEIQSRLSDEAIDEILRAGGTHSPSHHSPNYPHNHNWPPLQRSHPHSSSGTLSMSNGLVIDTANGHIAENGRYTVQPGENLHSVAHRLGRAPEELTSLNGRKQIFPGDTIDVPLDGFEIETALDMIR